MGRLRLFLRVEWAVAVGGYFKTRTTVY
eukprot:COSAG01_NODE_48733_length_378_cov_1.412186_1_plen_27_part_01